MAKLSSYQKLKAERNQMGLDLLEIITNPDSYKSALIKVKYSTMARIDRTLWDGDIRNKCNGFVGLMKMSGNGS